MSPSPLRSRRGALRRACAASAWARRATGAAVVVLCGLSLVPVSGCRVEPPADRSLHPPGDAVEFESVRLSSAEETRILARAAAAFAALDASARREAVDRSSRAGDPEVREVARLLRAIADRLDDGRGHPGGCAGEGGCADLFLASFEVILPKATVSASADALVTGYATPRVQASRAADARHALPILGDLRRVDPALAAAPRRAILDDPRTAREAIAWIADPLDWALVETNGTAELDFGDGETIRISRVATNGRAFTSLGRALAARGALAAPFDLDDVRDAARTDPTLARAAALDNERVVFFRVVAPDRFPPALGLDGRLLAGVSCAADQSVHPPGSTLLLDEGDGAALRLAFVHDAGGAIRGPSRVDLYFGCGPEAVAEAGRCRRPARVLRLAPRRDE